MIENKKLLYVSISLLVLSIVLNFHFPHRYPFGEAIFAALNIPTKSASGLHFIGIITLLLLISGLYFLVKSISKYHGRVVILTIVFVSVVPSVLVSSYQSTLATGIYAISYSSEESNCEFEMKAESTLHGECDLLFRNHSNQDIQFTVEFHERFIFEDDLPMVSLMNNSDPHKVTLRAKESKYVNFNKDIDVSTMTSHIEGGSATGVDIIIKSQGKKRELIAFK